MKVANRIPCDYFITSGIGESDITVHAGSYHMALKDAGIDGANHIRYSSILPAIARKIERPEKITHGSVIEGIMAQADNKRGKRVTAGLIMGWLYDKKTEEKCGGLVAEYCENQEESFARDRLKKSLKELYENSYSEKYELKGEEPIVRSFIPKKKYGTAIVAICFTTYEYPIKK